MTEPEIIEKLAAIDPCATSEMAGDPSCFFCGAWIDVKEPHKSDCIWLAAIKNLTKGRTMKDGKVVEVSGIHLVRIGDHVIVNAEMDEKWVEVIKERHDGAFSHIVEVGGMRRATGQPPGDDGVRS